MASDDGGSAYAALEDRYARYANLQNAARQLYWDEQVMMPEGGTPARSQQLSTLSAVGHELLTDDETARLLDRAEAEELDAEAAAVVREVRRQHERAANVPEALVEELTRAASEAQPVWREAKAEDDYASFAPTLERLRELRVERAEHIDPDRSPFEVMYEDSQPYLPLSLVEGIFEDLVDALVPLIERIEANGEPQPSPFDGTYPEADQRAVSEAALDELGYDRDRGRLDTAPHPFMSGNQFDARITTRYKESDPLESLGSTIHEFGHATYQLGLRDDKYANPLGEPRSSAVHESQSRFWENHVGRTRPFWERFLPTFVEHHGHADLTVDEVYGAFNRIYPDNLIRVEADELTYHLHIILRSEVGRAFVEGDIGVDEIPQVWNEKMDEYLGVVPETDAEGCLQDIHWTTRFAAFHGYTLGSVLAAQLDHALRADLGDVDALIRDGEYGPIREWMTEQVHRHGCRYPTGELVEVATGEPLTADYFIEYATEKFEALYGL
ncbi:MAG: carboxypeptidase M32 [Halobacteriales archaeon]|nr:carboxypeptidase M32 [Halobacteriales archaeon]